MKYLNKHIKLLMLLLLVIFLHMPEAANAQGVRDFSCYNKCVQGGQQPYVCNQSCIAKKEKILNSYGRGSYQVQNYRENSYNAATNEPTLDRVCYGNCIARGGSNAACQKKCEDDGGNPADNAGSLQECVSDCQKIDPSDSQCIIKCGESFSAKYTNTGNLPVSENSSAVDFSCFKKCRFQGEDFYTCEKICKK